MATNIERVIGNLLFKTIGAILMLASIYMFIDWILYMVYYPDAIPFDAYFPINGFYNALILSTIGNQYPLSFFAFMGLQIASSLLIFYISMKFIFWEISIKPLMKKTTDTADMAMRPAAWHFEKGEAMMRVGDFGGAISEFNVALKKSPGYPGAYYNLGCINTRMLQYGNAASLFQEELKGNPAHFGSRLNLGFCFIKLGRTNDAIRELQEATRLGPDNSVAHAWLGDAYRLAGKYNDALLEYQKAKSIAPDLEDLDLYMGENFLELGQLDDAIVELKLAANRKPGSELAHYKLGLAYSKKGRYEDAIAEYNAALRINPQNAEYKDMLELAKSSLKGISSSKEILKEKEVIKEIHTVKVPCEYCRTLVDVTQTRCPSCGAPLRAH